MGLTNYYYYKLFNSDKLRTAHHEAGHMVMAYLFSSHLTFNWLSINKKIIRNRVNTRDHGMFNFEWNIVPQPTDIEAADITTLIALSGMCAQTVYKNSGPLSPGQIQLFSSQPSYLDRTGGIVDYDEAKARIGQMAVTIRYANLYIQKNCIAYCLSYFSRPEIWKATSFMAKESLKAKNQTLEQSDLALFAKASGLSQYLINNANVLLNGRHPITINSFR